MPGAGGGRASDMSVFKFKVTITSKEGHSVTFPVREIHFTVAEALKEAKAPFHFASESGFGVAICNDPCEV